MYAIIGLHANVVQDGSGMHLLPRKFNEIVVLARFIIIFVLRTIKKIRSVALVGL